MYKYEVIIYWSEEDEAYLAEAPELPGCMAEGNTYQEALQNIQTIIEEWIETAKKIIGHWGSHWSMVICH